MRVAAEVIFKTVGDEVVLLDLQRGVYYGLDEIGTRVWSLMSDGLGLHEIVTSLSNEYAAVPGEIERSVESLLAELRGEGLVIE